MSWRVKLSFLKSGLYRIIKKQSLGVKERSSQRIIERLREKKSWHGSIDPEAAAEKVDELDEVRIELRASLKHKNAYKYLSDQANRSKNTENKESSPNDQQAFDDTIEDNLKDTFAVINWSYELTREQSVEEFNSVYKKYRAKEQVKKNKLKAASVEDLEDVFDAAEFDLKQKNKKETLKKSQNGFAIEAMEGEVEEFPETIWT